MRDKQCWAILFVTSACIISWRAPNRKPWSHRPDLECDPARSLCAAVGIITAPASDSDSDSGSPPAAPVTSTRARSATDRPVRSDRHRRGWMTRSLGETFSNWPIQSPLTSPREARAVRSFSIGDCPATGSRTTARKCDRTAAQCRTRTRTRTRTDTRTWHASRRGGPATEPVPPATPAPPRPRPRPRCWRATALPHRAPHPAAQRPRPSHLARHLRVARPAPCATPGAGPAAVPATPTPAAPGSAAASTADLFGDATGTAGPGFGGTLGRPPLRSP